MAGRSGVVVCGSLASVRSRIATLPWKGSPWHVVQANAPCPLPLLVMASPSGTGPAHLRVFAPGAERTIGQTLTQCPLVSSIQLCHQALRQSPDRIFNAAPRSGIVDDLLGFDSWPRAIEDVDDQPGHATRKDRVNMPYYAPGREGCRNRSRLPASWHCRSHPGAYHLLEFGKGHFGRSFANAYTGGPNRCCDIKVRPRCQRGL